MRAIFRIIPVVFLLSCLTASWVSATPIQNGSFSSGFDKWEGYIGQDINNSLSVTPADLISGDPHFDATGSNALLKNDDTFYQIILSQTFDLPAVPSILSFDYFWFPTDASVDTFQASFAVFNGTDFDSPIDLFNGSPKIGSSLSAISYNMSSYDGKKIRLDFILTDNDFNAADTLQVDNVIVSTTPVPEPSTLYMLFAGVPALLLLSRRSVRTKLL